MTATLGVGVMLDRSRVQRAHDVAAAARHVEELGLDGLFVGDHLAGATPMLDGTILLAVAAAATARIALGFAVMVPALRHVAWAAKQIATLQHVSGERLIVGVGSGAPIHADDAWEALELRYSRRGENLDEALAVLGDLIAGHTVTLAPGRPLTLEPAAPVPPLWIGGNSTAALRRAAEHGDGWLPAMVTPLGIARGARELRAGADRLGRPEPVIAVRSLAQLRARPSAQAAARAAPALLNGHGPRSGEPAMPITGDPAAAAERLDEYRRAGASELVLDILGEDWERQCELLADARSLLT